MLTVLLTCVLGQSGRAEVADLEFTRAQVEWIASSGRVRDLEQALPRRPALLIRSLGCEHGHCRALAREELEGMGAAAAEALCWGMRTRDPAIVEACRTLYGRLCLCKPCEGTGRIYYGVGDYTAPCEDCGGLGDLRLEKRWVDDGWVVVPADLFGRRAN